MPRIHSWHFRKILTSSWYSNSISWDSTWDFSPNLTLGIRNLNLSIRNSPKYFANITNEFCVLKNPSVLIFIVFGVLVLHAETFQQDFTNLSIRNPIWVSGIGRRKISTKFLNLPCFFTLVYQFLQFNSKNFFLI